MRKIMVVIVLILNGIILINACKKEKTSEELEYDTQTSEDNSLAEGTFNDVNTMANEAMENDSLSTFRVSSPENTMLSICATITNTPDGSGGGTIILNFGSTNCLCRDNRYRRGIINISYTGSYRDSGTVINTSFDNYFVGKDSTRMFKVTGTKTVTNNGHNANHNMNFSINVNGHLTNVNGLTMDWTSVRNREWINGEITPGIFSDDEYVITGSASGTNFEGNSFTVNITNGLHIKFCPYITEGTFELTPSGKPTRTFDYGDGTCDALATLTINGRTFNISLR
jgi:hypothetical protein